MNSLLFSGKYLRKKRVLFSNSDTNGDQRMVYLIRVSIRIRVRIKIRVMVRQGSEKYGMV